MTTPLLLLAAGGTGGHMFPAQALAEEMLSRGWDVRLSTDARGARFAGDFPEQTEISQMASASFARGGIVNKVLVPMRIAAGVVSALISMIRHRPAAVVGFGGYPTIPALIAAKILSIPSLIHEQNGILGRVNGLFARRVRHVACGVWPTELPDGASGQHIGNPVRAAVLEREGAGYIAPGDYPMDILVMGGSQGARVLSDVVPAAISELPEALRGHLRVSHQARGEDEERVRAFYAQAGIRAEVAPFFDDIARRISEAQLVISRAGASSIADLSVIGRPSILVPFAAAAGDHQTANARGFVDAGAAILIPESQLSSQSMAEQITTILQNPQGAAYMAEAAHSLARVDATQRLADLVVNTAQNEIANDTADQTADQPANETANETAAAQDNH